jgi:hypothetical protein
MREFDICLETHRKLEAVNEQIIELESVVYSPRNQIISDMPRGRGGNTNGNDALLMKLDRLRQREKILLVARASQWRICEEMLMSVGAKQSEIQLMCLRFFFVLPWNDCARAMNWNINKCFRIYRKMLALARKSQQNAQK